MEVEHAAARHGVHRAAFGPGQRAHRNAAVQPQPHQPGAILAGGIGPVQGLPVGVQFPAQTVVEPHRLVVVQVGEFAEPVPHAGDRVQPFQPGRLPVQLLPGVLGGRRLVVVPAAAQSVDHLPVPFLPGFPVRLVGAAVEQVGRAVQHKEQVDIPVGQPGRALGAVMAAMGPGAQRRLNAGGIQPADHPFAAGKAGGDDAVKDLAVVLPQRGQRPGQGRDGGLGGGGGRLGGGGPGGGGRAAAGQAERRQAEHRQKAAGQGFHASLLSAGRVSGRGGLCPAGLRIPPARPDAGRARSARCCPRHCRRRRSSARRPGRCTGRFPQNQCRRGAPSPPGRPVR